ncbi:MAG: HDOD domain-containing protein [Nitrosomonadales bacterium]|nr:HDOD domain-containing protein [Nitrosomonadales bacterium]
MNKRDAFEAIANQAARGILAFPTGAQVALKLRQTLNDPDCMLDTAARLILAEPLLAARVISMANSVVYNRSGREITDVRMAVSLIGFRTIQSLAMALVTRQMAGRSSDPKCQELVQQLWEHSAHVASLAQVIARHVTHQDPEAAMFAGIIHEIGGFYMLSRAAHYPGLLDDDFTDWLEFGEVEVGRAVLARVAVPESVTAVIEGFWDGFLAMPPVTLADTLLLAEELSPVPSPLHRLKNAEEVSSMAASIEMLIGEETLTRILGESAEEISSLTKALQF